MRALGSLWVKSIAVFLVFTMLCYDVVWASPSAVSSGLQNVSPSLASHFPSEFGRVEEILASQNGKVSAPLIYHLQDAHAVYEAQSNLAGILETLIQKEGISLVLVEGGSGNVNLTSLRGVAWKTVRRQVAEEFLRQGKILGEEYLQVASNYPFELIGIEDDALYRSNVEVFLRALRRKPEAIRRLTQIESHVRSLEAKWYSPQFRELDRMRERWQKGEGNLIQYLLHLKAVAEEKGIETASYPEWNKLSNLEKGIDPSSFDQNAFFQELKDIENKVRSEFLTDQTAKSLWQTGENIRLLRKLFNFELASDEYEKIRNIDGKIDVSELASTLEAVSGNRSLAGVQNAARFLDEEKGLFLQFYELAEKRDQAFMRNIERILKETHPRKAVLITGGFHSKHLGELFKKKGISRILISPGISQIDTGVDAHYEKILREKSRSTLRAPATLGTPYFVELKTALEREQSLVFKKHVERLIGYLDVDEFFAKESDKTSTAQSVRSELREIHAFVNILADLSSTGTAVLWGGLAGLVVLGAGYLWHLHRNKRPKAVQTEAPKLDILPSPLVDQSEESLLLSFDGEDFKGVVEPLTIIPVTKAESRNHDPAKAFGLAARRFFEGSFPVVPSQEDLPPPPYELPLPIPADAVPQDQDARGKVAFILREVLQAMETMDGHMRSQQKESAERALAKVLEEGEIDPQKYRRYLQEDLHQFFRGVADEIKKMSTGPGDGAHLAVSEEIEESHPRFPRLVKHLLSEHPALLDDAEIKALMSRISGKFSARPPVAPDIEDYIERTYKRLKALPAPQPEHEPVAPKPVPKRETPAVKPSVPKRTVDSERIKAQLRDLERMHEKLERDKRKLNLEIQKIEAERHEIIESLNQARADEDRIIEAALRPSIEAYEVRLEKLRTSRDELTVRLDQLGTEEARLNRLLTEDGGGNTARSEVRVLAASATFIGVGLLAGGVVYLAGMYRANQNAKALTASQEGSWPFEQARIYKETVPLKEGEKTNLFKDDNAGPFIGLGVLAGWVIGGIILYHAYHSWDWASKALFEYENAQNYHKKEQFTLGALLWILEIFGAPFIGAFLGYITAFLTQTITNFVTIAYRALRFLFDYERAVRLHLLPYDSLSPSEVSQSAKFLSRMEKETLEVILQNWVERGEHEKIKAFSEKGIWQGDKKKFIQLYEDVAGLEQAKKLLIDSFASKDEHKEAIAELIRRWKTSLDRKRLNGSHLLKDLIPALVKSERMFKGVRSWIERLNADAMTPWQSGFVAVKTHYDASKQLDELQEEASRKFALTDQDKSYLESQLQDWRGRIPAGTNQTGGALQSLALLLGKAVQISPNKAWFSLSLKKISEIDKALFHPSKQKELLARFDQAIGYEMAKGRMLGEADAEGKKVLTAELASIESHLKNKGVDAPSALTGPLMQLRTLPPEGRIGVLQRFRTVDDSVYKKDLSQVSRIFEVLAANEQAKVKLIASGNGSLQNIRQIESSATLTSFEDISHLSGFYSHLAEKTNPPVQHFLLSLTARAPPGVMPVFIRSRQALIPYYLEHPTGRDYDHLPGLAEDYRRQYGSLQIFTGSLLDLLTDPKRSPRERLEEARRTIAGQTLIRLGYPENVIETRDAVSVEAIMDALSGNGGEDLLKKRAGNTVVKSALSRMGRLGLYSYWESSKPAYYLQFLEETKGIDPAFFKPGEKLRVAYDGDAVPQRKTGSLVPVKDPVGEMKALVAGLRVKHPNIYENFIAPKRELLNGKPLEDVIDEKTLLAVAKQFKSKVADWPFSDKEKMEMTLRIHEVLFSRDLQPLLGQGTAEEEASYWKEMLRLFGEKSGLKKDSDLSRSVVAQAKRRIDELTEEAGTGRDGVVQFILTRGTISDFVRGEISEDCCAEHRNLHFNDTVGLPTDPAFLSFKLVENGKWIGNIYSIVLKDQDGKFIFYLDNMPVRISHPVTTTQAKADKLINGFYQKLKAVLEASGFDYFVTAPDPSSRENIRNAIRALGGTDQSKATTKPGGYGQKTEFGGSSEYIQGLGTLSSSISANGKWITLDNRAAQEKRRQLEIQELQRTLRAADSQQKQLEKTKAAKATQVRHLKERSQNAEDESKTATAQALRTAAEQGETELSRLIAELSALEGQVTAIQAKLHGPNGSAHASRSEMRVLSTILAQFNPANGPVELLLFLSVAGLLGWIGWELLKGWLWGFEKEEPAREPETYRRVERESNPGFIPPIERPVWFQHPLVMEISDLFRVVLRKVSKEMRPLIPRRLFFPIPPDFGMRLSEQIIKTLSAARIVLTALRDHDSLIPFMKKQTYYQKFKERTVALGLRDDFDAPNHISTFHMQTRQGQEVTFSLELSDRTADDLLKGDVSHDCTGLGACAAFYETIPQFLLDPGFLNFKLRMDGKWVGNIYLMVAEKAGKPVLVIDAVQFPPAQNQWPIHPIPIAQAAVNQVVHWAREQNFDRVLMSSFVSNFTYLYDYFNAGYPREVIEIEKLGGFEHLKELGFWDSKTGRNQYIETFSSHWNEPLENVDPNQPSQNLYLRPVWEKAGPGLSSAPAARSEVRANQNWSIEEFDLEIPSSDLQALGKIEALKGVNDQDILTRSFQSQTLKIPDAFHEAGYKPGMKIRVRVHDDTDDVKRVYKFMMVTPMGRRNFILEVSRERAVFWRPYTENLNLIDTALMTGREHGKDVDLRDIFRKHGEPEDSSLHEIPSFGTIYAHEKKEYWDAERELKVFDLQIKGNENPSLRIATLPADGDFKKRLPKPKAEYDFEWEKRAHVLLVYSLKTDVHILDLPPDPKPELSAGAVISFPRTEGMRSDFTEEKDAPVTPQPEPIHDLLTTGNAVRPVEPSIPDSENRVQVPSLPRPEKPISQDEIPEEPPREPITSKAAASVAQAGPIGMGAQIAAQARRMAASAAQRKLEEKVRRLHDKIAGFKTGIGRKIEEVKTFIESFDIELPVKDLLVKIADEEKKLKDSLDAGYGEIQDEINQYQDMPELAVSYEALKEAAAAVKKEIDHGFEILSQAKTEKVREKVGHTKSKLQNTAKTVMDNAAAVYARIQAVSLDLSPKEIVDQTKVLEQELVAAVEAGIVPIDQEVGSFNLEGLQDIYAELAAIAQELQQGILTRLQALESEEPVSETEKTLPKELSEWDVPTADTVPPVEAVDGSSKQDLAKSVQQEPARVTELAKEILSKETHLASVTEKIDQQVKESGALASQIEVLELKKRALETELTGLERSKEQKVALEGEIGEIGQKIEENLGNLQALTEQLARSRAEHEKLLKGNEALDADLTRKREELERVATDKGRTQQEFENMQRELTQAEEKATRFLEKETRLQQVTRKLDEKETKLAGKKQQIEETDQLLQKGQADLKTLTGEIENQRKVLRGLNQSARDLKEQITGQNKEFVSLRKNHAELSDEIRNLADRKRALEEELGNYEPQREEAERALNQMRAVREEAERAYQGLLGSSAAETAKLESLRTQIAEADRAIREKETLLRDLSENEKKRSSLLGEIAELGRELESKQATLKTLSTELSEVEENSRTLREDKEALIRQLEEFRGDLESLENLKNKAQAEYDVIEDAIRQSRTSLGELPAREQRLVDVTQEISQKELALRQAEAALSQAEEQIEERNRAIQNLDSDLSTKTQAIQTRTRELAELEAALKEKTETARTLDGRISSLRQQVETLKTQKQELETELEQASLLKTELNQTRQDLQEALRQKEQVAADYEKILADGIAEDERLSSLHRDVTQTEEKIQILQTSLQELEEKERRHQSLTAEIGEMETKLGQARQSLEELVKQAAHRRTEHEEAIQDRQTLQSELGQYRRDLKALETQKTQLQGEIENLEQSRTHLLGEVKTLREKDGQVKSLQAELEKARTDLAALKTKTQKISTHVRTMAESQTRQTEQLIEMQRENTALLDEIRKEREARRVIEAERNRFRTERDQALTKQPEVAEDIQFRKRFLEALIKRHGANAVLQSLFDQLPESVWTMLQSHFPNHQSSRFPLVVDSLAASVLKVWNENETGLGPFFQRIIKDIISSGSLYAVFQQYSFYQNFKNSGVALGLSENFDEPKEWVRFEVPGEKGSYALELAKRDAEYLVRGLFSADCTNCGPGFALTSFIGATGTHIVDPGFFNFKVMRYSEDEKTKEWVGNIYALAMQENGKPVLLIDAMQIPWQGVGPDEIPSPLAIPFLHSESNFPVKGSKQAFRIAEGAISALTKYAEAVKFQEVWLSTFVSNFGAIQRHFHRGRDFSMKVLENRKIGGWDALKVYAPEALEAARKGRLHNFPYYESIARTNASRLWQADQEVSAKEQKLPSAEAESSKLEVKQPSPQAKEKIPSEEVSRSRKPSDSTKDETAPSGLIQTVTIKAVVEKIREQVNFAYEGILIEGSEFIVSLPNRPVRWVTFVDEEHEWKLFEKEKTRVQSFPLYEIGTDVKQQAGNMKLANVEVEITPNTRVPLLKHLELPQDPNLSTYLEAGGMVLKDDDEIKPLWFSRTGFLVDPTVRDRFKRATFFVHPGSASLERKESITLPLENQYNLIRRQYPHAQFILGWHTNPGPQPYQGLHPEEVRDIQDAGFEGMQLVVTPNRVQIFNYTRENGWSGGNPIYSVPPANGEWISDDLAKKLVAALEKITGASRSEVRSMDSDNSENPMTLEEVLALRDSIRTDPAQASAANLADLLSRIPAERGSIYGYVVTVLETINAFGEANPAAFTDNNLAKLLLKINSDQVHVRHVSREAIEIFKRVNPGAFTNSNLKLVSKLLKETEYSDVTEAAERILPLFVYSSMDDSDSQTGSSENDEIKLAHALRSLRTESDLYESTKTLRDIAEVFERSPRALFETMDQIPFELLLSAWKLIQNYPLDHESRNKLLGKFYDALAFALEENPSFLSEKNFRLKMESTWGNWSGYDLMLIELFLKLKPSLAEYADFDRLLQDYDSDNFGLLQQPIQLFLKANNKLATAGRLRKILIFTGNMNGYGALHHSTMQLLNSFSAANPKAFDESNLAFVLGRMREAEGYSFDPHLLVDTVQLFFETNPEAFNLNNFRITIVTLLESGGRVAEAAFRTVPFFLKAGVLPLLQKRLGRYFELWLTDLHGMNFRSAFESPVREVVQKILREGIEKESDPLMANRFARLLALNVPSVNVTSIAQKAHPYVLAFPEAMPRLTLGGRKLVVTKSMEMPYDSQKRSDDANFRKKVFDNLVPSIMALEQTTGQDLGFLHVGGETHEALKDNHSLQSYRANVANWIRFLTLRETAIKFSDKMGDAFELNPYPSTYLVFSLLLKEWEKIGILDPSQGYHLSVDTKLGNEAIRFFIPSFFVGYPKNLRIQLPLLSAELGGMGFPGLANLDEGFTVNVETGDVEGAQINLYQRPMGLRLPDGRFHRLYPDDIERTFFLVQGAALYTGKHSLKDKELEEAIRDRYAKFVQALDHFYSNDLGLSRKEIAYIAAEDYDGERHPYPDNEVHERIRFLAQKGVAEDSKELNRIFSEYVEDIKNVIYPAGSLRREIIDLIEADKLSIDGVFPYIQSLANQGNGEAQAIREKVKSLRSETREDETGDLKKRGYFASGYQLRGDGIDFLTEAVENGEKSQPRNIKTQIQKLYFDLGTSYGLDVPGLEAFIEQSDFNLVVVKPERKRNERAPPMGFGIESGRPGRDVFATFELAPKEGEDGFEVTIYVGRGIYELAEEKERLEIFAHELYQAYRVANEENPDEYPVDIDFELKIDEEIRRSQEWEPRIPNDEREDLGLLGGVERRTDAHVRARAFARLLGTPSANGIGTTYTQLLRNAYALSRRFTAEEPRAEDPLNAIPPLGEDAFRYAHDSFENVVSAEGLQRLFEMSAYVHEHKEEEVTDFLTRKVDEGRNVLLLNQNAPTPWILKDTRKMIETLAADGKLSEIFLDLPPRIQPLIDQYLETGRSSAELSNVIASRFPPFLPREFQRPDLYENLLRAVYEHNLEAGNGGKIQVTAYYEGRKLPPMPQQGEFPPMPGAGGMPFRQREDRPFQPPFQERDDAAPPATFPGRDLPFPPGLPLPQLPLTKGVKEAFQKALSDAERRPGSAVLFLKPLDELFPEELNNHPRAASILHIDKYTGYGPEKPENQLALYMSEQASPNQKSFALPILSEAPFFEESINPGLPKGIRFNDFNVYPDLILSTSGDGDENMDLTPDEVTPEEIAPLVPVGGRSELRVASPNAIPVLKQRDAALKELIEIGEPAVGPLLEALTLPSVTVRLGAIQALGAIGDLRAIGPLNQLTQAVELREAAKLAVRSIREHPRVPLMESRPEENAEGIQRKPVHVSALVTVSSLNEMQETLESGKSLAFIQTLLKQTSLKVDLDVESLVHKEGGQISLSGWGFVEALKMLEAKLPNEFFEKIRIRLVNLNPQIRRDEIERAFGLTPELKRIVEITNIPVRHTAFKGIEPFLEKDALKIASERNRHLWENHADILVKEPGTEELIDGRKLFLAALLHRNLRSRISKELKAAAIRLLREIGDQPVNGVSYFNADSRTGFNLEVLNQMDQINRMLASMA